VVSDAEPITLYGLKRFAASYWGLLALLGLATVLRLIGIGQWSLWQDEEMSIYLSQDHRHIFVRSFPPFFKLLSSIYAWTGISTSVGRAVAGAFGVLGIAMTYGFCRKHASPQVGLIAALFLTVTLGHLFWSQSIRYYTMLAAAELATVWLFYEGLEQNKAWKVALSGLTFTFAMVIHFTAVLLLPVLVGYLLLVFALRQAEPGYRWQPLAVWSLIVAIGLYFLLPQFLAFQRSGAGGPPPVVQPPLPLLVRITAYYGVPVVGLALASLAFWRAVPIRFYLLAFSLGVIPNLEIIVLGVRAMANITWYHAFVAMHGAAILAAVGLVGLASVGWRKLALTAGVLSTLYYGVFLGLYYTTMHGDRPRWEEACAHLQQLEPIEPMSATNSQLFATVPEVIAYYLGVPPDRARPQGPLVQLIEEPPRLPPEPKPAWYLVKASHVSPAYEAWFNKHCEYRAAFPAHTGPVDRTVRIYYWPGKAAEQDESPAITAGSSSEE